MFWEQDRMQDISTRKVELSTPVFGMDATAESRNFHTERDQPAAAHGRIRRALRGNWVRGREPICQEIDSALGSIDTRATKLGAVWQNSRARHQSGRNGQTCNLWCAIKSGSQSQLSSSNPDCWTLFGHWKRHQKKTCKWCTRGPSRACRTTALR